MIPLTRTEPPVICMVSSDDDSFPAGHFLLRCLTAATRALMDYISPRLKIISRVAGVLQQLTVRSREVNSFLLVEPG